MTQIIADRVKEASSTTGTGPLTLGGAVTGFRAFSAVCSVGDTVYYAIEAVGSNRVPSGAWEVGLGTYSAANTLARTTVLASSNAGAAVDFGAGTKYVWLDASAAQLSGSIVGADPTGVADSTAAIQAYLDRVEAAGGGEVIIPAGIFKVSNTLLIGSNVHVRGAGRRATILRGTAGAYAGKVVNGASIYCTLAMVSVNRASVESLTVDHATNGTIANGIAVTNDGVGGVPGTASVDCTIRDCEVLKSINGQYCIWNFMGIGTKILHNYVDGGITTNSPGSQEGIESYGGTDVLIEGNTVRNVGNNGIYTNPDALSGGTERAVRIINNYVETAQCGIRVQPGLDIRGIHVRGNQIKDCWAQGIKATISSTTVLDDLQIKDNSIEGGLVGIALVGAHTATLTKQVINGNAIESPTDADSAGIQVAYWSNLDVVENVVRNSAGSGILIEESFDVQVAGNRVDAIAKVGIYLSIVARASVVNNWVLFFNGSNAGQPGILLAGPTSIVVDGNIFNLTNLAYPIYASSGDKVVIGGANKLLYTHNGNPVFRNDATNPNRGTFTLTAASTSKAISNTLVNNSSFIDVVQTAGTLRPFTLAQATGSFTLTFAAAVGDETFKYEIR